MIGRLLLVVASFTIAVSSLQASRLQKIQPRFEKRQKEELLQLFYKTKKQLYTSSTISYKKGWNLFISPKEGIDIPRSFQNAKGLEIVTFDPVSKVWAVFPNDKKKENELYLESIEGGIPFFILAKKDGLVKLFPIKIINPCRNIFKNSYYETIEASGFNEGFVTNSNETFYAKSRYLTQHEKGTYKDTRILIAIPKIHDAKAAKHLYKYGPAVPKSYFLFTKEYEGKFFYLFNYHDKKCYKGIFPSERIPPFPFLKSYN